MDAAAKNAAATVKRVAQELGGKSPNIVLDDDAFAAGVGRGVGAMMMNSGQTCSAPTRMLVPSKRMDEAIAVARAVLTNARILLLDEPLAAMGAREARLIIDLIDRLKARGDIAIVMIAHNYAQTLEICDRIILMQHGEVTFESHAAATSAEDWRKP